jgi:ketosteroid isomerase-like protein
MSQHKKFGSFVLGLIAVLVFAGWAGASDKQKNKKNTTASDPSAPLPPVPDTDQIEHDIGEMLGAFQLGDIDTMHKHYADNVTFVSGDYAPPIVGWQNYAALYESQRSAFQGMQLIRSNTLIVTHTDIAWAMYQWEFISSVNGKPFSLRGQTTLIFNKVSGNWLIVHNHTSGIYPQTAVATPQQTATAAKP